MTGYEEVEVSAGGRAVRTLSRKPATPGSNLILSIDIELQKVVEQAFGNRRGALIAIEPATGDVLAYVSMPSFDPNLFVDGIDQQSWDELNTSPDKPLVNRPAVGQLSAGLHLQALHGAGRAGTGPAHARFRHQRPRLFHTSATTASATTRKAAMARSTCTAPSCTPATPITITLANDLGVDAMHDFMKPFGFGQLTGIDLEHEKRGILPSTSWKRAAYRRPEQKKWYAARPSRSASARATTPSRRCSWRMRPPSSPTTAS